jgi:4-hydroxy-2-oxoglutarate aldolase
VCGSTGESDALTAEEKLQLWEWVAQWASADKLLIAGTGVESVRETVALTNRAAGIGYKAAMVRTPHYYKNLIDNGAAQMLYFRAVADQAKIPIFIYNWPQITGVDIPAEAVAELSHHPNIIAIKESSGNLDKISRMVREVKKGFQVLTGSAPTLAQALAAGASGAVLAFANAAPYATISIWEAHRTREPEAALDWEKRISNAALLVTVKYGVPGLKYAMDLAGYYGGPPRLPLIVPAPEAKKEIEQAFADLRG